MKKSDGALSSQITVVMKMVRKVVGDDREGRRWEVRLKEGSPEEMALRMSAEG